MDSVEIKHFVEAALLAAGRPLSIDQLQGLFDGRSAPDKSEIRSAIATLNEEYADRGILIAEVASGFRVQVRQGMADRLQKLWEGRAPRYSRALFETLALIAYRQPITRGEIEEIRGVTVSSNIVRSLLERDWVRIVGHRDVPGRPEMFGTTRAFLDYFGLKKLDDLPPLADLADWESLRVQLDLPEVEGAAEMDDAGTATDLPVLYPASDEQESSADVSGQEPVTTGAEVDPDATGDADADAADDLPRLVPIEDDDALEEQLIVSEWPDPSRHGIAVKPESDSNDQNSDDEDSDASATGA